jgi:large subunit ribosomal protein L9
MKVVLLKDVGGVGVKGAIKEVADGYGQNFLIARGLAEQATPDKVKKVQAQMQANAAFEAARDAEYAALVKKLNGASITIESKANEKGHLYKQVASAAIAVALKTQLQADVSEESINLEKAIKEAGESKAVLKLGTHTAHITIMTKAA